MSKKRFLRLVSLLLVSILTVSLNIFPTFAEDEVDKSSPMPSKGATTTKCDNYHFYGSQLDTSQETQMYFILERHLLTGKKISKTGSIEFDPPLALDSTVKIGDNAEISKQVGIHLQRGLDAFKLDHPQMYWITGSSAITNIVVEYSGSNIVSVKSAVANFQPALSDFQKDDDKINGVVNAIVAAASKQDNHYNRIKTIHNMLANHITYTDETDITSRAFQISGGLVDKSGVCEAYSKAFKMIAEKLGYRVVLAAGTGVNKGKKIAHMWNYIEVEGKWYAVDVTWDDQAVILTDYLLVGANTPAPNFNDTTFKSTHIEEYTFHTTKYKPFKYPTLSKSEYPRP